MASDNKQPPMASEKEGQRKHGLHNQVRQWLEDIDARTWHNCVDKEHKQDLYNEGQFKLSIKTNTVNGDKYRQIYVSPTTAAAVSSSRGVGAVACVSVAQAWLQKADRPMADTTAALVAGLTSALVAVDGDGAAAATADFRETQRYILPDGALTGQRPASAPANTKVK